MLFEQFWAQDGTCLTGARHIISHVDGLRPVAEEVSLPVVSTTLHANSRRHNPGENCVVDRFEGNTQVQHYHQCSDATFMDDPDNVTTTSNTTMLLCNF
jgi:hypothetical protein